MKKMNKKGFIQFLVIIVTGVFLAALALPFLFGGGLIASWNIGQLTNSLVKILKTIPTWAWIIIGILILLSFLKSNKRRR